MKIDPQPLASQPCLNLLEREFSAFYRADLMFYQGQVFSGQGGSTYFFAARVLIGKILAEK
jgi:hypothetical protein